MTLEQNTFEYINNVEETPKENIETNIKLEETPQKLTEDFVTGLPSWDLEPPYEVVRRVNR